MSINEYIKPELLIMIPVLYLIGAAIKKSAIDNRHIPLILGAIGIVFSAIYLFASEPIIGLQAVAAALFTAFTQGVLCAGASVYANQIIKQETKKE